jgi:hypothetical protein
VVLNSDHPTARLGRLGDTEKALKEADHFAEIMSAIDAYILSLDKGLENAFEAADALEKVWSNTSSFDMAELLLAKLYPLRNVALAKEAIERFEESLEAYSPINLAMQVLTLELRSVLRP